MIKAVVFDLDNTLVDFMAMKRQAVDAAIAAMRDAGLKLPAEEIRQRIDEIYKQKGIEFQNVFDQLGIAGNILEDQDADGGLLHLGFTC